MKNFNDRTDEIHDDQDIQLFFNSPEQNPYSGLTLHSKISQRSKIINDLVEGRANIVDLLAELQNLDDVLIGELIQGHRLAEHFQQEAAKWKAQAEQVQLSFDAFRLQYKL